LSFNRAGRAARTSRFQISAFRLKTQQAGLATSPGGQTPKQNIHMASGFQPCRPSMSALLPIVLRADGPANDQFSEEK
jgi:hypothetical protein